MYDFNVSTFISDTFWFPRVLALAASGGWCMILWKFLWEVTIAFAFDADEALAFHICQGGAHLFWLSVLHPWPLECLSRGWEFMGLRRVFFWLHPSLLCMFFLEPDPYIAPHESCPVAKDFGLEIRRPLLSSNSCTTYCILFPSFLVQTYMYRSSANAAWFHRGIPRILCMILVESGSLRRTLKKRSKRTGEKWSLYCARI